MFGGFNAFGDDFDVQQSRGGDQGCDDGLVLRVVEQLPDEGLVDLDLIAGQALQVAE
nr:hypothetical protein [Acidihalobacter prosperus]